MNRQAEGLKLPGICSSKIGTIVDCIWIKLMGGHLHRLHDGMWLPRCLIAQNNNSLTATALPLTSA